MNKKTFIVASLLLANCANQNGAQESIDTIEQQVNTTNCMGEDLGNYWDEIQGYLGGAAKTRWTKADCKLLAPVWTGNDEKGQLFTPLWHGANAAVEDWIPALSPGACNNLKGTVRIDWDKATNKVNYTIKVINAPARNTQFTRIDGGDPENPNTFVPPPQANFWTNQFHNKPKDLPVNPANGIALRLWTIFITFNSSSYNFYYDANNLLLKGSELDYPSGPPAGSFPVRFPISYLLGSKLLYPDKNGYISHQYSSPYDHNVSEGGTYSHLPTAFVPHNLCRALQYQPVKGQLRPYVPAWRPPSEGQNWQFVLRQGLSFDVTVEEGRPNLPPGADDQNTQYGFSGIAYLSNTPAISGGIPWGAHLNTLAAIQNVGPPILQVPKCGGFNSTPRVSAPLYCQGQQ